MRTTISLPDPLFENAKRYAEEHRITLSVLVEDALRCRLAEQSTEAPPEFQLVTVRGKLVNPELDLNRTSMLLGLEDEERFLNANARR